MPDAHRPAAARDPLHISPDDPLRSRLFPRGALLGLGLLCAATLALVYPGRHLMQLLATSGDSTLAIDYLRHLVALRGDDAQLRLMLAQRYLRAGESAQALATITSMHGPEVDAIRLHIWSRRWYDARALGHDAEAARARTQLIALLGHARPATFEQWRDTLTLLEGLDDPQAVAKLAGQITRFLPLPPTAAEQAAALLSGAQRSDLAAKVLFDVLRMPLAPAEREHILTAGAKSLLAANHPLEAYDLTARAVGHGKVSPALAWLLVRLALGAGDPQGAARWLREAVDLNQPASRLAHALTPTERETAWTVLMSVGDLKGAVHIADAALAADPGDGGWARRRAQVLEWNGQPAAAMQQWIALLRRHFTQHALDELHRLALALNSADGLDLYWAQRTAHASMSTQDWLEYAQALEVRGKPDEAVAILRKASVRAPALLQPLAWLLSNMGEVEASLDTYAQALRRHALDLRGAIDFAVGLLQAGRFEDAARELTATQHLPGPDDLRADHQELLGDLSWDMGRMAAAEAAYASLWNDAALRPRMPQHQIQRLVTLTRQRQGDAAALAMLPAAWAAAPSPALGLTWLHVLVRAPSAAGFAQWQQLVLGSEQGKMLLDQPELYAARAQVWSALGNTDKALDDLRTALRLAPGNIDDATALLWMEIDANDRDALRRDLPIYGRILRDHPAGLDALSAAAQILGDNRQALAYARALYPRRKSDALWLLNYGDLLEQSGDSRRARAAYDQAWRLLEVRTRTVAGKKKVSAQSRLDVMLARLRLSRGRVGARGQQALIAALRQELRSGTLDAQQTREANAAIADWLLGLDTTDAARWWLARRVLTSAARASAELQIAMRDNDPETVARLLRQGAGRQLQPQDLAEAERVVGRPLLALRTSEAVLERAAEHGESSPALRALAQQTAERELELANTATAAVEHRQIDSVTRQGPQLALSMHLGDSWRVTAQVEHQTLRSTDSTVITGLPPHWTDARLGAEWQSARSSAEVTVRHNAAVGSLTGLSAAGQTRLPGDVLARLEGDFHDVADESSALQVAGRRDRLQLVLTKDLGRAWATVSTAVMHYATRNGDPLGHGGTTQAEVGLWLRQGEPDLSVKLLGYSTRFSANDGPPLPGYAGLVPAGTAPDARFFIPAGDDGYGVGLGFNVAHADTYSGRWLPYAELDVLQSRRLGLTHGVNFGVHGPVFGGDALSLSYQRQQDTSGLNTQWRLQYRLWFGR